MNKQLTPLIETRKVKKYFPLKRTSIFQRRRLSTKANEDISITIYKGETFGLVGESGCGKTTLGRVILQLYQPTSGSVLYYGISLKELNPDYVIKEIKHLPKYQEKARKAFKKSLVVDTKIESLKAVLTQKENTKDQSQIDTELANLKEQIKNTEFEIKQTKAAVVGDLQNVILRIVDEEAIKIVKEISNLMLDKRPLSEVQPLFGKLNKRYKYLLKTYEKFLKLNEKPVQSLKDQEKLQRATVRLNNNIARAKEMASNNLLKQRILANIKTIQTNKAEAITLRIIKRIPYAQAKLYKPLFGLYKKLDKLNDQLSKVGHDLVNEKRLKRLENKSTNLKKEASRQLREGSKTAGQLILEYDIKEISELMLKRELLHRQNCHLKKEIQNIEEAIRISASNELESVLQAKRESSASIEEKIESLTKVINSYKGKNVQAITERTLDKEYQKKMEGNLETGINLSRLNKEEMRRLRQRLQIIFQDPYSSLNPRLTVGQTIEEAVVEHGLFKKGTPELEKYIVDIMAKCGLDHYMIHRYAHQFSGGQRQRIGIARALALMPEFVVCDESVSALDVSIQSQILNLLDDLKKERDLTYLFISHDLSVIKHISDRIGVMYLGDMVELCDSEELYLNPLHPYSKALLSAIPTTDNDPNKPPRIILEGDIPSNIFPPSGCKFRTRCPIATEHCAKKVPVYREVAPNHFVKCHFYEKTKDIK